MDMISFLFGLATIIASALVFVMVVGSISIKRIAIQPEAQHGADCDCLDCDPAEAWRKGRTEEWE